MRWLVLLVCLSFNLDACVEKQILPHAIASTPTLTATVTATATATPTPTNTAAPTSRPIPTIPAIVLDVVHALPGTTAILTATLVPNGAWPSGTQNDIGFSSEVAIAAKANGKPDCIGGIPPANPPIANPPDYSFGFKPNGCGTGGVPCTSLEALVFGTVGDPDTGEAIEQVLYTCNLTIAANAAGVYVLPISGIYIADVSNNLIQSTGLDGVVIVDGGR
jgi:hypothetical protein